jgi:hypothetical protein
MIPTEIMARPDRSRLAAVARADSAILSPDMRKEVEELLTPADPVRGLDRSHRTLAIYVGIYARVAANAFAATERWKEAWQAIAAAVPEDPSDATEAAELHLLEILLDALYRGVEATGDRLVDDVEPLIRAGHRHPRCVLLNAMHQLLLMSGRVDESLRLLHLGRIDALEQLTGIANLLDHARPNVFTVAGEERVVAGAERIGPYTDAIVGLWRELPLEVRKNPLTARDVVIWAQGMTGEDVSEALTSFGPDDGLDVEQLCRRLRWFGLTGVVGAIADALRDFDFARTPTPGYLVACLGRVEEAVDMFVASDDWAVSHRLLRAIRDVPSALVPRLVGAIDALIDSQVNDPEFTLDGSHHTVITVPELLRRRAFFTGEIRALSAAPGPTQSRLAASQAEELIALDLATGGIARAVAHYAGLSGKERHDLVTYWGRYHSDVPSEPLMRMLLELAEPEMRALAIAHYVAALAQRGLILGSLLR